MPLYEYKCNDCEDVFSELRNMDERGAPIACPDCGGAGEVLISQVASGTGEAGGSCAPGST